MSQETKNAGVALILSVALISAVALVSVWVREYLSQTRPHVMATTSKMADLTKTV